MSRPCRCLNLAMCWSCSNYETTRKYMQSIFKLKAQSPSIVDTLRQEHASTLVQVLGIVGFSLLTILGAQVRIYLWEVPFTLQAAAVYGSGLFLGWRGGMLSQLLYIAIGMFFPVFSGDGYGWAYLMTAASAGYIVGFPLAAAAVGYASKRWNSLTGSTLAMVCGSVLMFTCGVIGLHYIAGHATWLESVDKGWLRFIPVDLAKILFVSLLYTGTRRIFGK